MATSTRSEAASDLTAPRQAIRTPRAAAIAGIVFAVLLISALVIVRITIPANPHSAGAWLTDSGRRRLIQLALTLVPFSGIAFLWFIGVVRDRIGEGEDRFFATVFLGSGLLFVAMLFVAAGTTEGLVGTHGVGHKTALENAFWDFGHQVTNVVLNVYAMRMAGVFMISTSTILFRTRVVPRWLALLGYVIAVLLLVTVGFFAWIELLFPLWVLTLSTYILIATYRTPEFAVGQSTSSP